jgi:hypothetical protein
MLHPVRASSCPGHARRRRSRALFGAGAALLLGACASVRPMTNTRAVDDLEFLARAGEASPAAREVLWKETLAGGRGPDNLLRIALLQAVPEHSGYDPAAAQRNLRAVLAQDPPDEVAAMARVRLYELRSSSQCLGENQELRKRLAQVVDIERQIDDKRRQ